MAKSFSICVSGGVLHAPMRLTELQMLMYKSTYMCGLPSTSKSNQPKNPYPSHSGYGQWSIIALVNNSARSTD